MSRSPSTTDRNGADDRDTRGRFRPGNKVARGNPHAKRVGELRSALLKAITPTAIRKATKALIREAEAGNVQAARELIDRAIGKPIEIDLLERIEALEARLTESDQ